MHKQTAEKLVKKVEEDYDTIADEFAQTRHKLWWDEFKIFLEEIKNGQTVIDIGCGNGRFAKVLKENKKKVKYLGLDISEKLIKIAQKNHPNEKFIKADCASIPIDTESADIAVSTAVIHHIPSRKLQLKAISEAHRILKPKGKLLMATWNLWQPKYKKYIWKARLRWLLSLGKYGPRDTMIPWGKSGVKRYYHAFTLKELENLLTSQEFKVEKKIVGAYNITFICKK